MSGKANERQLTGFQLLIGDKYPISTEGRIIGALLMTAGVGLFGTFTAYVASFFLQGDQKSEDPQPDTDLAKEIRLLRERIESLEKKMDQPEVTLPAQFGRADLKGPLERP